MQYVIGVVNWCNMLLESLMQYVIGVVNWCNMLLESLIGAICYWSR